MGGAAGEKSAEVSSAAENSAGEAQTASGAAENGAEEVSAEKGSSVENTVSDPNVLLDNEWAKITVEAPVEGAYYIGYSILIENRSDQYIWVQIENGSVDGSMTDLYVSNAHVAPGKKSKAEIQIYVTEKSVIKSLNDLKNVEGIFEIAANTDGGNEYTVIKDSYPFAIADNAAEVGPGESSGTEGGEVTQTDYVKIEGIYVDNSYLNIQNMRLVYVFTDMFTNAENLEVHSGGSELIINDTNSYTSWAYDEKAKSIDSYYYALELTPLYIGNSKKVLLTFLVPPAELEANRSITMKLDGIPDTDKIKMSTNDIIFCSSEDEIAQKADPEGYAKLQPADAEATEKVRQAINGKGFDVTGNGAAVYRFAFKNPDKFETQSTDGTRFNGGTYTVEAGYLACKYDAMVDMSGNKVGEGTTTRIPWKWGNDGIELNTDINALKGE